MGIWYVVTFEKKRVTSKIAPLKSQYGAGGVSSGAQTRRYTTWICEALQDTIVLRLNHDVTTSDRLVPTPILPENLP